MTLTAYKVLIKIHPQKLQILFQILLVQKVQSASHTVIDPKSKQRIYKQGS